MLQFFLVHNLGEFLSCQICSISHHKLQHTESYNSIQSSKNPECDFIDFDLLVFFVQEVNEVTP